MSDEKQDVVMTFYNEQTYTITERSDEIKITKKDIEWCVESEDHPYTGSTDEEFADYVMNLIDKVQSGEMESDDLPFIVSDLYENLVEYPKRNHVTDSLQKSGHSTIYCMNKDGDHIADLDSSM